MKKLTGLAVAGIVSMLATTLVSATPIMDGTIYLDASSTTTPVQIFEIDTEGFDTVALSLSAVGGGSIDPCGNRWIGDCLAIGAADAIIVSDLSLTNDWQFFGPFYLTATDPSLDLIFSATITGADESMTINWELHGDTIPVNRVIEAPEPAMIALLGLGLLGFGMARRRSV